MTWISELRIAADPAAWIRLGLLPLPDTDVVTPAPNESRQARASGDSGKVVSFGAPAQRDSLQARASGEQVVPGTVMSLGEPAPNESRQERVAGEQGLPDLVVSRGEPARRDARPARASGEEQGVPGTVVSFAAPAADSGVVAAGAAGAPGIGRRFQVGGAVIGVSSFGTERAVSGLHRWTLAGDLPDVEHIDGLPTAVTSESHRSAVDGGRLGATRIDHVVVMTPSLDRTCGAITQATGQPLKRIREAGPGLRQGFHRFGEVIVEVVERADLPADSPASFWGLVLVVADLDAAVAWLGPDLVWPAKQAVQPGRRIATITKAASLGVAVAIMSE